jgi:hypothetical protein
MDALQCPNDPKRTSIGYNCCRARPAQTSKCTRPLGDEGRFLFSLRFSFRRQFAQQTPSCPNRVSAPELRCLFAVLGSYFHRSVFNRIGSTDNAALKYGRNFSPDSRRGHNTPPVMSLFEADADVHPVNAGL